MCNKLNLCLIIQNKLGLMILIFSYKSYEFYTNEVMNMLKILKI